MFIYNFIKQYNKQFSNGLKTAYLSGYSRHDISKQYNQHYAKGNSRYFG